jgi:hypothetical protein
VADVKVFEPVLLAALAKQGIAASNVELWHDYAPRSRGKGYSPYARHFLDTVSGKIFAIISGLPGCDAYGQTHEMAWSDKNGVIENGNNIFHGVIDKGAVRLIALSDQPDGAKKDEEVNFNPQLFIDGTEVLPLSDMPRLLEVDPINENYHNNTLEWDYGVCLRRIRIIEGRFLGSWVFITAPKGDILIKYNQSGKFRLRLQYAKDEDTEYIPEAFFDRAGAYPVTISDSATFYPDPHAETSSVDSEVWQTSTGTAWTNLVNGAGAAANDSKTTMATYMRCGTTTDQYTEIDRMIFLFDTSSLPDSATISAATLSLRGNTKSDSLSASPDINIYSSNPASNTQIVGGDFDSLGNVAFSTTITYAGFSASGYNDFALNASGLAAISLTGVSKFGARNVNHDVADSAPPWVSNTYSILQAYTAEQGSGYQPKLVVTYTTGVTEISSAENGAGAEVRTSGHPIVMTSDTEISSGAEAALKIAAFLSGDTGLGSELSWMQKQALAGDAGGGADALKALVKTADSSSDMRLYERLGQAGMPSKQVKMPSKGVNL